MMLMNFSSSITDKTTERPEGKATTTTKPTSQTLEILRLKTEVGKDGTGIQFFKSIFMHAKNSALLF